MEQITKPGAKNIGIVSIAALAALGATNADAQDGSIRFGGYVSEEIAYTYKDPRHWSRAVTRLQLTAEGKLGDEVKWKLGGRVDVDPVYAASDFYTDRVKRDQRVSFFWRENYIDFAAGDWAFRFGAQNIIWGEVAGLFFADVVSARDLREFLLPPFDVIRTPQWALRTEYFAGDSHLELVWIPVPVFDNIGKPGADFYPVPITPQDSVAAANLFRDPIRPDRKLSNGNFGVRLGTLVDGWDVAAFYYRSFATSPTFYAVQTGNPLAPIVFEPRYDRIWQLGATVTKDLETFVLRSEVVYADGQNFASLNPAAPRGVVARRTLDWIISAEQPFTETEGRVNLQLFKRHYFGGSDDELAFSSGNWGASVLVSFKAAPQWEPSLQWIQTVGGGGAMIRPKLTWTPTGSITAAVGLDIFKGSSRGFFGRFDDKDRVYVEARYAF